MKQQVICQPEVFQEALAHSLTMHGIAATTTQKEQWEEFYCRLIEGNNRMNLTALTAPVDVAEKHIADSLQLANLLPQGASIADVGSGAGLPGVPLAILRPDCSFVLLDALAKRCHFLEETVAALGLSQVKVVHLRAEDAGQKKELREHFQIVTARAVAPLAVLAEYCLPLLATNGLFLAMKGDKGAAELAEATAALQILGGKPAGIVEYVLAGGEKRSLLKMVKVKPCPSKYPRRAGVPEKQPLA